MPHVSLLNVDDIDTVRTTNGLVLIKPGPENDHIIISHDNEETKVWIDTSYEREKHSITWGEVFKVCDSLDDNSIPEIKKGDKIFFHYLCCINAIDENKYIINNNQIYYIVNYSSIFCAKRGDDVITLNGYIIVDPIDDSLPEINQWGMTIPKSTRNKNHCNEGIVKYVGTPLEGEEATCKVGDRIFYRTHSNTPLQYSLFSTFEKDRLVYRMKYDNVMGIRTKNNILKMVDIFDMPGYEYRNGFKGDHSVSERKISFKDGYPVCNKHGYSVHCRAERKDGKLYRCSEFGCDEGCFIYSAEWS